MKNTHKENPRFKQKLALLSCAIALLTSGLISSFYIYRTYMISLENGINHIASQTHLAVPNIKNSFLQMYNDAFIFTHMPAIKDYADYKYNQTKLQEAHRTPKDLLPIISTYFINLIQIRPEYMQVRFIGIDNNGKEIVRVNRTKDGIEVVQQDKLQEKGNEPYFKDSLSLKDGQTYFSKVTLNREHNKIDPAKIVMIRNIVPVIDEKNKLFGFIVINAEYGSLLRASMASLKTEGSMIVTNEAGDYMMIDENGKNTALQFHEDSDYMANPLSQHILSLSSQPEASFEEFFHGKEHFVYYVKIPFSDFSNNSKDRFLGVALIQHKNEFLAPQQKTMEQSLVMALIAICLSPLLAWPLASGMSDHFKNLLLRLTESEESEKKALQELRGIVDNAVDGIITINKQGLIQTINPACVKLFGYSPEELIGQNIKMLMPDKYSQHHDQYLDNYHKTRDAKIIGIGREVEGRKKNGEIFAIDLSVAEISTADSTFYSGVVRDISARKKAENLLRSSNAALIKSNAELDDFAYIASHDLKEPLRAIFNNTRFLMEDHGELLPEDAKNRLNKLLEVSLRMDKLIDDLLNFSRLSRNEVTRENVDMNLLLKDVIQNIAPYIEERNGQVFVEDQLPPAICDRVRVISIFQNLIINALKYNDQDRKIVKVGFKKEHTHDGITETDVYFVQDNGIGIDAKFKDSVFRIFKRLHSPKTYGQGTGSGLTFTKKNVERHGGSIWFESVVGEGTVFYFTLKEKNDA